MLMILPLRWGIMRLAASWLISKAAVRLTATVASHWSRPKSSTSASGQMPALLIRMSTEPSLLHAGVDDLLGAPGAVMSASMNS